MRTAVPTCCSISPVCRAARNPCAGTDPRADARRLRYSQRRRAIPPGAERAYNELKGRVDGGAAMDLVRFMDQYWRVSGNPGFNASVDRIRDGLQAAGLRPRVEEFASRGRGWDYQIGTVTFADTGEVLLSRERDRVSLCINSFSTPAGGLDAPIVDVGAGTPADFEGKDVKGAVVLGAPPRSSCGSRPSSPAARRVSFRRRSRRTSGRTIPRSSGSPINGTSSSGAACRTMRTPSPSASKPVCASPGRSAID